MDPGNVGEIARVAQLLGGGVLAFLILRLVLPYLDRAREAPDAQKRAPANGSLGEREVKFWERMRAVVKTNAEELMLPPLGKMLGLEEVATARLISMDAEGRAMFEAEMKELAEILRQSREIGDMLRRRNEADASARAAMQVGLSNYARDVSDLSKMIQKLLDKEK